MFENNLTGYTGQASFTPEMRAESMLASIISSDTVIIPTYFGTIGANSKAGGGNGFYFASLSNPYAGKASVPSQLTDMMDRKIDDGHPQNGKMLCGQDGSPRLALVYLPSGGTNCIYTSYPSELCNRWGNSTAYFVGSDGMCSFGLTNKF